MSFRSVFIAVVVSTALLVAAFLIHRTRPRSDTEQPTPSLVRASGKCASCHTNQQNSIVHEYELSKHAQRRINCLECHEPAPGQEQQDHHGFVISRHLTAANCRSCHERIYQQFLRSRHAAPSWAAVYGAEPFTDEQLEFSEQFHPGACRRPASALVALEGGPAATSGCAKCHAIGKPNSDGTIGTCTACHTRHSASVEVARLPSTCGQCHMGPDHSQLEIYTESKHGVLFEAQRKLLNLKAESAKLTTADMFVPTCSTCHMSGLNTAKSTHDTSERLSFHLAAEVSEKRLNYAQAKANMQDICLNCHTRRLVDQLYTEAEQVVDSTNHKILSIKSVVEGLRAEGLLGNRPFAHPIDFSYFDLWHYYGRTSKHGAYMGGADFVQWHGNYPILKHSVEIEAAADELRKTHARSE
jgi:hypothetical protein